MRPRSFNSLDSERSACSVRVLTVPSGMPSRSATWLCVRSPWYWSSSTSRWRGCQCVQRLADVEPHDDLVERRSADAVLRVQAASVVADRLSRTPPPEVDGGASRQRVDERPHRRASRVIAIRRAPQPHERLLHEVLREPAVVQEVHAEGVEAPSVEVVEGRERLLAIPGSQAGDERSFAECGRGSCFGAGQQAGDHRGVRRYCRFGSAGTGRRATCPRRSCLLLVLPGREPGHDDAAAADPAQLARLAGRQVDGVEPCTRATRNACRRHSPGSQCRRCRSRRRCRGRARSRADSSACRRWPGSAATGGPACPTCHRRTASSRPDGSRTPRTTSSCTPSRRP